MNAKHECEELKLINFIVQKRYISHHEHAHNTKMHDINENTLPCINNICIDEFKTKANYSLQNKIERDYNKEEQKNSLKSHNEINTKLHIRIRDRCKVLISNAQFPACSYMKLRRKLRILSASPKRNISNQIHESQQAENSNIFDNERLLAKRARIREQVQLNLNTANDNKELTHKVFELYIRLKNQ